MLTRFAGLAPVRRVGSTPKNMESRCDWMKSIDDHCEQLTARFPGASRILTTLHQPLTPLQSARRTSINLDRSCYLFWILSDRQLVECLNPQAHKSRLYWLTTLGRRCQVRLRRQEGVPRLVHDFPDVDWALYGWICHRHRSAVVNEAHEPLQPIEIKRRARQRDETIRMSANNVRDVIRLLLERGIVERLVESRHRHPKYRLTPVGRDLRQLLLGAQAPSPGRSRS